MKNLPVAVHNDLISMRYSLTDVEGRVILELLKHAVRESTGEGTFQQRYYTRRELATVMGDEDLSHRQMQDVLDRLMGKKLYYDTDYLGYHSKAERGCYNWLQSYHISKKGKYVICLSNTLVKFLINLKKNFTLLEIDDMLKMSPHTRRLYMMAKQRFNVPFKNPTIAELISIMILGESYNNPKLLMQKVLKPAEKQINEHSTVLNVSFAFTKEVPKRIMFNVTDKQGRKTKQRILDKHAIGRGDNGRIRIDSHEGQVEMYKDLDKYGLSVDPEGVEIVLSKI